MAFDKPTLSYFHSFSKMPAQNSTTLGNAINKSGHTVTASEVWASDIPYYGKMGSLDDVKSKVQPYARKNDMCYITAGTDKGKTFIYDGEGNWTQITLTPGMLLKNSKDENVLLYHSQETLTNLTADNNANTDSANNAARLWTTVGTDGQTCAKRLVEQFVAPTDKALNGLASVAYAPVIGTLVAGTDFYDYCFSGTILWGSASSTARKIDCFEYIGPKVSTVVDTVSAHSATIKTHSDEISELKDKLGLSTDTPDGTPTLGGRVTDNETALRVLLGLEDGDKVVASESIATTAAKAVSTSLVGTTDGTIGKAIADAKQEALNAINAIQHFSVQIVPEGQKITDVNPLVENTIYLVSEDAADGSYVEYIAFKTTPESAVTYERIGTTKIDLEGYTTDAEHTALADRVTALDSETGRVAVVEGKVSTLEGQVATITSTDATTPGSIAKALADAKGYTDTAIETELAAGGSIAEQITNAIKALGDVAVKSDITITEIKVKSGSTTTTLTPDSNKSVTVEIPEVQAATTDVAGVVTISDDNAIAIDETSTAAATVAAVAATRSAIATEMGAITATITDIQTDLAEGDTSKAIEAAQNAADAAMEEAQAKVASVTGPTTGLVTVKGDKEVTIEVSETIATKSDITTEISNATSDTAIVDNDTSTKLVTAKQVSEYVASEVDAIDTGVTSISVNGGDAQKGAVSITALDGIATSSYTGINSSSISISNEGNKVKLVAISAQANVSGDTLYYPNDYLATAADADVIATFRATEAKKALADTAITGDDLSVTGSGISVTLGGNVGAPTLTGSVTPATYTPASEGTAGSWTNETYLATASDVETAIADAVDAITIPDVTTTTAAQTVGVTASGHAVDVATADYISSTKTGELGEWTEASKGYLVTGATVADAISDVNAKVDALHKTPQFKVVVVDGVTDLTKWQDSVTGGIQENYIYLVENIDAADGSYIEYIAYKNGETLVTERIGTTKTDLTGYAKSVTINGETYTATADNAGVLNLGTVVTKSVYNKVASQINGNYQSDSFPNNDSITTHIFDNGSIAIGIDSATDSVMGVSKMFTGDLTTTDSTVVDTAVSVKSAQAMYSSLATLADSKLDHIEGGSYLALSALVVSGYTVSPKCIDTTNDKLPKNVTSVIGNIMFADDGEIIPIEPEKIYNDGPSFNHFAESSNLVTWCADLPGIKYGGYMFASSEAFTSFSGDLSNLTNGYSMFGNCFALTSFCGDLSGLEDAENMFDETKLNLESVECIADTINESEGTITILWNELPEEDKRQAFVDELSRIVDKGWTLETNPELLPLFDSEKYETGSQTVQPLDLDSEPQTIYYVVKK